MVSASRRHRRIKGRPPGRPFLFVPGPCRGRGGTGGIRNSSGPLPKYQVVSQDIGAGRGHCFGSRAREAGAVPRADRAVRGGLAAQGANRVLATTTGRRSGQPARIRDPWCGNLPGQGRDGCRAPMAWEFPNTVSQRPSSGCRLIRTRGFAMLRRETVMYLLAQVLPAADGPAAERTGAHRAPYRPLAQSGGTLAFARAADGNRWVIALNLNGRGE